MLLVSINNLADESWRLQGAAAAFLVGSLAVVLGAVNDQLRTLLTEPVIVVLGLGVATLLGAGLANWAVVRPLRTAVPIGIGYGMVVPMIVAALIALPLAPIAAVFAIIAWPVTIPTALAWLALLRWGRSRAKLTLVPSVSAAIVLAAVMLVIRFTQPGTMVSAETGTCVTFPGERIAEIAWSPDGEWLGVGSEGDAVGTVRLIEQATGRIIELARGPYVDVTAGLAVGRRWRNDVPRQRAGSVRRRRGRGRSALGCLADGTRGTLRRSADTGRGGSHLDVGRYRGSPVGRSGDLD